MKLPKQNPIAVVSGMPHSGTTYLSQLICENTDIANCAFECGVLLASNSPRDFSSVSPFYDWLCMPVESGQWGLSKNDRDWACDTDSWEEFYQRLALKSPIVETDQYILDKTPAYCYSLEAIMQKVPDTHFFISIKDPHSHYCSFKKRNIPLSIFIRKLNVFHRSLNGAKALHPERIHTIQHQSLCEEPKRVINRIFSTINIEPTGSLNMDLNWQALPPIKRDYNYQLDIDRAKTSISEVEYQTISNFVEKEIPEIYAV